MPVGKMMKCVQRNAVNPPPGAFTSGGFYPFWQGGLIPWLAAFCIFLICGILLFERKKFFLQKNRDPKFSIILIIKEIMVHKKRRKKL